MQIESSHLSDVEWSQGVLTITFRDGASYEYYDVPQGIFQELLAAGSPGRFFRENIKGQFDFQRV